MNECTICFETMNINTDKLTMCLLCGKSVHTKCYKEWKKKVGPYQPDKCLYCQREAQLFRLNRSWWENLRACCC